MCVLDTNTNYVKHGVFTSRSGVLSNDFFVNLMDMSLAWKPLDSNRKVFEGRDRLTGKLKFTATVVDLVFGSNAELRAVAEVYTYDNGDEKLIMTLLKHGAKS